MREHPFLTRVLPQLTALADQTAAADPTAADPTAHLSAPPQGILVAFSGGPDSTALLLAAHAWRDRTGRPIAAAHLDHQLRGADSTDDAAFCRDLCAHLDIPCHVKSVDPRPLAGRRGRGLEEAARQLRRRFFAEILAAEPHLACVATGHHRDDQAETVLLRLMRGCGLDGLRGMRPRDGITIHPLLVESRADILAFLADVGQPWRQDRTNDTGLATRNRVRRELLPLLRDIFGAGAVATLPRLAELAEADLALLDGLTEDAFAATAAADGALLVAAFLDLPPALGRRVLRRWLFETVSSREDLAIVHVESVRHWLAQGRSGQGLDLPHGVRLWRDFDHLRAVPGPAPPLPMGQAAAFRVTVVPVAEVPAVVQPPRIDADGGALLCPQDALVGHLRVENWREGDALEPLGLGGCKKLSDLLREKRIPAPDRGSVLLVRDASGILWVPGVAQSERTRVLPSTRRAVTILLQRRHLEPDDGRR